MTHFKALLLASLIAISAGCGEEPELTEQQASLACCECACTDGTDVCLNIEATAAEGEVCADVCVEECAAQEGCTEVETADYCPVDPNTPQCITVAEDNPDETPDRCAGF